MATTEDGQQITEQEETLLKGVYPTKQWRAGDYVRSVHDLKFPEDAPHGKAIVRVSLTTADGQLVGRADGAPIAGIEIVGRTHNFDKPKPQTAQAAQFGDAIRLVGDDLDRKQIRPGEPLTLVLHWQALKAADKPYTVFVHLLDANGQVIGQKDAQPMNGEAPTDVWQTNEYIADEYSFDVTPSAPHGAASLEIGLY